MSDYTDGYSAGFLMGSVLIACALILLCLPRAYAKPVVVGSGSTTSAQCTSGGGKIFMDAKTGKLLCCWDSPASKDIYCERCSDCKAGDEVTKITPGAAQVQRPLKATDNTGSSSRQKPGGVAKPMQPLNR